MPKIKPPQIKVKKMVLCQFCGEPFVCKHNKKYHAWCSATVSEKKSYERGRSKILERKESIA